MKKLVALFLIGIVVVVSGCMGGQTSLTKEKVLTAVANIETAKYDQNFSMSMRVTDPNTNETFNTTMFAHALGIFNKSAGLETGNMSVKTHARGMNITMNWPYFINGTRAYFKVDGKWYVVPSDEDLYTQAKGSLNVGYIEKLLKSKNVTIKKLANGYAFRVNLTFWEFVNATNQTDYLDEVWGPLQGNMTVDTNAGWVEVHLRNDGTPTFIETYMDITMTFNLSKEKPVVSYIVVHESVALSGVNSAVDIKTPKGIESAGNFEDILR